MYAKCIKIFKRRYKRYKMDGYSKDIVKEDIEKLKSIFPQCVVEGKVKIDQLLNILGEYEEREYEKYEFTWKGKNECYKTARERTKATLIPCESESVNFNDTENLYIEGDNLEVLKILQHSYYNKIKMIYIDPPYNTGNDFVYKDDYRDSLQNYKKIVSSINKSNPETSGRFHTDWLNMMFPRLMLAHTLLKDDGVIFISIDDNEVDNLKKICNEVFGEENFISCFIWNCSTAGGIRPKFVSKTHEYILCYAKNKNITEKFISTLSESALKMYNEKDSKGIYRNKDFVFKNKSTNINQKYEIICPDGEKVYPKDNYIYRFVKETFEEALKNDLVVFKKTNTSPLITKDGNKASWNIYIKKYLGDGNAVPSSIIPKEFASIYNVGTQILQNLFNDIRVFENAKPLNLLQLFIKMLTNKDDIVLDFFSGSATTSQAVMQLNAEDGGNRKYIMVQLPQLCDEKTEAYKNGYKNICEIGKERIRRAGQKIKEETEDTENLDIGFRVFKLDSSNFSKWDIDLSDSLEIEKVLKNNKEIIAGRNEIDAMFEILIKNGFVLTEKIYSLNIDGYNFYHTEQDNLIMVSFDENIPIEVIEKVIKYLPKKIILTMSAFKDTSDMVTANHIANKDIIVEMEIIE